MYKCRYTFLLGSVLAYLCSCVPSSLDWSCLLYSRTRFLWYSLAGVVWAQLSHYIWPMGPAQPTPTPTGIRQKKTVFIMILPQQRATYRSLITHTHAHMHNIAHSMTSTERQSKASWAHHVWITSEEISQWSNWNSLWQTALIIIFWWGNCFQHMIGKSSCPPIRQHR